MTHADVTIQAEADRPVDAGGGAAALDGWDALLADGGLVHLRLVDRADAAALRRLHDAASDRSIYLRYFTSSRRSGELYLQHLLGENDTARLALIAEQQGVAIGMASCEPLPGTADAEVAFLVADSQQHRGVGTLLLEHLAALARQRGVRRFVAETLVENGGMLRVFADAGFTVERQPDIEPDTVQLSFPISPTVEAQAAVDARERSADARSLRYVLAPTSVAVVGASDRPGSVGGAVLRNIVAGGFIGEVYPVNRRAGTVGGLPAYPSVADLPTAVDLAVIAVPAPAVEDVLRDCGRRGVPAVVIITSGFGEAGEDGAARERVLLHLARRLGIRVVGPNCLGVACTDPDIRLNATFSGVPPTPGSLGFASQSGALGIALLQETARRGLGISGFVSLGNKLDVSGNDTLLYWEADPRTRVVALYLESFGNPQKFARHAARIARGKPIIALKAGRTAAGGRAGASHTAAVATPDAMVSALLRQAGVIRVDTTTELLDIAQLLAEQPLPAGRRLGILGNSGGPGILAADTADACGLQVLELSARLQEALDEAVPGIASGANPVDLGAAAGAAQFEHSLGLLLDSGEVDAVVVIYAVPLVSDPSAIAAAIRRPAASAPGVPVAAALLGTDGAGLLADPATPLPAVPVYDFPESAVRALGQAARHAEWRRTPPGTVPEVSDVDVDAARSIVLAALAGNPAGGWLDPERAAALVAAFGIPVCPIIHARTPHEAVAAAERVGYPVALKTSAPVVHKSDVGGVRLGLRHAGEVADAFERIATVGGLDGVVVQPMQQSGLELLVGVNRVEPYAPMVVVGLGGTSTELLGDKATRLAPLTDTDAHDVLRELRTAPLLSGYRGSPAIDVAALEDLLVRVGLLATEIPELAELDLNPVIATPGGIAAVDAKIRLAPIPAQAALQADPLARRLR